MDNGIILKLAKDNPGMSDIDRLVNIYHLLSHVLVFDVPGDVVELGCHAGKTSVFLQMLIEHFAPDRELHLYDSFQGFPPRGPHDDYLEGYLDCDLHEGDFKATEGEVQETFRKWKQREASIHAGWFQDTLPHELPEQIAFAYLDSDLYDSIMISLESVYPRLSTKAVLMIDDYCDLERNTRAWPGLPGVKKACDEFFRDKPEQMYVLAGFGDLALGYMRKV